MSHIRIHTTPESAVAIVGIAQVCIHASWKQTTNQTAKKRSIVLDRECVTAPDVPESFRALVEACLLQSAEQTLKDFVALNPNNYEVSDKLFTRPQLTENFLAKQDNWIGREELEKSFVAGATWKRISSRPEFASNLTYQHAAQQFKENILKLSAKTAYIGPDQRDQILAKLEETDLQQEFGGFILRRFDQMKKKDVSSDVSFADL